MDNNAQENELFESFQDYKRENFLSLGKAATLIYILLSLVDYSLAKENLIYFILARCFFILPTAFFTFFKKGLDHKSIDSVIFVSFLSPGIGVALISVMLGGLSSDYYFGLLIISFAQFSFVPMGRKLTLLLDFIYFYFFFGLNILLADFNQDLLVKQISNYLSFSVLKFFVVQRSSSLILDALRNLQLRRQLHNQKEIQSLLGELCHLFNNPLFISMTLIRKLRKSRGIENEDQVKLDKIFEANERMSRVLQKMLAVTEKSEDEDEDEEVKIKDLLN